jgi:uncharacterized protein involved in type VI secretion and phage assembly
MNCDGHNTDAHGLSRSIVLSRWQRAVIEQAGGSLKNFTVLWPQGDPYRIDTPANHLADDARREAVERVGAVISGSGKAAEVVPLSRFTVEEHLRNI